MKNIACTFVNKCRICEVLIQDSVMSVMMSWLFLKSRTVNFLNNAPEEERFRMLNPMW